MSYVYDRSKAQHSGCNDVFLYFRRATGDGDRTVEEVLRDCNAGMGGGLSDEVAQQTRPEQHGLFRSRIGSQCFHREFGRSLLQLGTQDLGDR